MGDIGQIWTVGDLDGGKFGFYLSIEVLTVELLIIIFWMVWLWTCNWAQKDFESSKSNSEVSKKPGWYCPLSHKVIQQNSFSFFINKYRAHLQPMSSAAHKPSYDWQTPDSFLEILFKRILIVISSPSWQQKNYCKASPDIMFHQKLPTTSSFLEIWNRFVRLSIQ